MQGLMQPQFNVLIEGPFPPRLAHGLSNGRSVTRCDAALALSAKIGAARARASRDDGRGNRRGSRRSSAHDAGVSLGLRATRLSPAFGE